jgi:hypothetical protein
LLKTIRIRQDGPDEYHIDDCTLIQNILIDRGYYATLDQCYLLWKMHSECYGAGWLGLYEDKESVYDAIRSYFEQDSVLYQG